MLFFLCGLFLQAATAGYQYELQQQHAHKIHLVTLSPKEYEIQFVKAHNQYQGRETVPAIAMRHQAEIAINGGFFQIGPEQDGIPSGTLVIQGKVYSLRGKNRGCLIQNGKQLQVDTCASISGKITPQVSAVMGIPILLTQGKINPIIFQKKSAFYAKPKARTAVGIKANGDVVIVVVEHSPFVDLQAMPADGAMHSPVGLTLAELAELFQSLGCESAINLDGGGSSTLWIKDRVVNYTLGDEDESMGEVVVRPVSDAILFKQS